jgi:hypothetical protein
MDISACRLFPVAPKITSGFADAAKKRPLELPYPFVLLFLRPRSNGLAP